MGEQYDAPNQQVVRPDGSGPADEGTGGSTRNGEEQPAPQAQEAQTQEPQEEPKAPRRRSKSSESDRG